VLLLFSRAGVFIFSVASWIWRLSVWFSFEVTLLVLGCRLSIRAWWFGRLAITWSTDCSRSSLNQLVLRLPFDGVVPLAMDV